MGGFKLKKIILFIYLFPFLFNIPVGLAYNSTASMPIGWYLLFTPQNIKIGDTVLACAPLNKYSIIGIKRGYIGKIKNGLCPYNTKYLVKKVVGLPYETVVLKPYGIVVNGKFTAYTVILNSPLPADQRTKHYPYGRYKIKGYWLISTYNKLSYDSRYFGPVKKINYKALYIGTKLL